MTYAGPLLPISVHIFERNVATPVPGRFIEDIGPLLTSYEHSIARNGGFESLTLTIVTTIAGALSWIERLACAVMCYDRDANIIWEGLITSVSFAVANERIDLSLDDFANLVRVQYQSMAGPTIFTGYIFNPASVNTYGEKEITVSAGKLPSDAAPLLQQVTLKEREWPVAQRTGGGSTTRDGGQKGVALTIIARGWSSTLRWLQRAVTNVTFATHVQIREQVTAYQTRNPFFSTDYSQIESIGPTTTIVYEDDQTMWDRIVTLAEIGDSTGQPTAWGVGIGRRVYFRRWAGYTPTIITYRQYVGLNRFLDRYGSPVPAWRLQPDSLYQIVDLVDPGAPLNAVNLSTTYYVERIVCRIDENGITARLEPSRTNAIDVIIARSRS